MTQPSYYSIASNISKKLQSLQTHRIWQRNWFQIQCSSFSCQGSSQCATSRIGMPCRTRYGPSWRPLYMARTHTNWWHWTCITWQVNTGMCSWHTICKTCWRRVIWATMWQQRTQRQQPQQGALWATRTRLPHQLFLKNWQWGSTQLQQISNCCINTLPHWCNTWPLCCFKRSSQCKLANNISRYANSTPGHPWSSTICR